MRYNRKSFTNNNLYAHTVVPFELVSLQADQLDVVSQDCDSRV